MAYDHDIDGGQRFLARKAPDKPIVSDTVELSDDGLAERLRDVAGYPLIGRGYRGREIRSLVLLAAAALSHRASPTKQPLGEVTEEMVDRAQEVLLKYVEDRAAIHQALTAALASNPPEAPTVEADKG